MEIKYRVISDDGEVYEPNSIITSTELVNDYIECLNEVEDKDTITYLHSLIKNNYHVTAIDFIKQMWGLQLEQI